MQPGGQFSNECDFAYGVPKRCDLAANLEDFTKPQTQVYLGRPAAQGLLSCLGSTAGAEKQLHLA